MDPLSELRELCMALPEVTERVSHGEPTWFVTDKKVFVTYADHHQDARLAFWCAAPMVSSRLCSGQTPTSTSTLRMSGTGDGWGST